jgi:tetratricopeptide (TPR) repeat protein
VTSGVRRVCNVIPTQKQFLIVGVFVHDCLVTNGRLDGVCRDSQHVAVPEATGEPESIGARIRRLRLERGLSQRDLSEPGVSYAYVSRIEAGARQPSLKAIRLLAGKLGVSPEYLETGAGTPKAYDREIRLGDAEVAVRLGETLQDAERTFRAVLDEARQTADVAAEARAGIGLGVALAQGGRHADAVAELERAQESPAVTPASRPDAFVALGRCYAALGETRRAVKLFERCLADVSELAPEDTALEYRFRSHLSHALAEAGELEHARTALLEVGDRVGSGLEAQARVRVYRGLGRTAAEAEQPDAAMAYIRRAAGLVDASEDALELGRAHLHSAEVLLLEDDPDRAGPHLERADRLFELSAEPGDLATLRTQQAHRAVRLGEPHQAIERATEALGYLEDGTPAQGSAWHALGAAHALTGDVESASDSLRRSVELLREGGAWREAMTAYRVWAKLLREAGRNQEAFEIIEQATLLTLRNAGSSTRRSPLRR